MFRLYGKLPSKSDHFAKHLKERKYFDSGDYAMSKAGKGDSVDTGAVGSQHPVPENIPHLSLPNGTTGGPQQQQHHHPGLNPGAASQPGVGAPAGSAAGSPVKEGSFLQRQTSASADEGDDDAAAAAAANGKDTGNSADAQAIPRR